MIHHSVITIVALAVVSFLEGIFPYFAGRTRRLRHALPNITVALVNAVVNSLFLSATIAVMRWSKVYSFGILEFFSGLGKYEIIIAFLLFDAWMYYWHRINHRIFLLWRFHRVHHNDVAMDVTTALRFHPGEIIISNILNLLIFVVIGMRLEHFLLYRTVSFFVVLFHHSNIALPEQWDRVFRAFFVTPNMHRVHHSKVRLETDSNYSSFFSIWDRLFATFRKVADTRTIIFGLEHFRESQWQNIKGMLLMPAR